MKITTVIAAFFLLAACNNNDKTVSTAVRTSSGNASNQIDSVYVERNTSITTSNAYSDLFLDSSAISQYIKTGSTDAEASINSFYNYRNNQYAWFTTHGLAEHAKGFWNLQDKLGSKADKTLRNRMDSLLNNDSLVFSKSDTFILQTELALTKAFLEFYKANRDKTHFAGISAEKAIPAIKESPMAMAERILQQDSLRNDTTDNTSQYAKLKQKLRAYTTIAKDGPWSPVMAKASQLRKGAKSPAISQLKRMLQRTGDMKGTDTSAVFNDSLVLALRNYQRSNGLDTTGIITDTLIRSINMPFEQRIQKIIINLSRAQWMPVTDDANYISVNIPDYMLTVYENRAKVFEIPVAVGKQGTNTTMFTGDLNQIVFSPYWNVPRSIVEKEILPKMKADKNYLKSRKMEIVGKNDSIPTLRQLPGKDNALGRVKFLFPNRYDIYFHDTYAKEIFNKDKRAVSHGCIRLQDAEKLATYLLRSDKSWTTEKIRAAMNAGKEQYVKVSPAMPVVITYYTVWVDENGNTRFRDDLYGNDAKAAQLMFEPSLQKEVSVVKDSVKSRP